MDLNTIEYEVLHDLAHAKVSYNAEHKLMLIRWGEYVNFDQLKEVCELHLSYAAHTEVWNVLSDVRGLKGTWTNHLPYLTGEYTIKVRETGLKKFAFLISGANPFQRFSAKKNVEKVSDGNAGVMTFTDENEAMEWVLND